MDAPKQTARDRRLWWFAAAMFFALAVLQIAIGNVALFAVFAAVGAVMVSQSGKGCRRG